MPVNERDIEWETIDWGEMHARRKQLGEAADGEQLGCSLYELPPGEEAWPYHYHTANEEALFVLAGEGVLRVDGETHTIESGEYAAFPANESGGHHVSNNGSEPLRYLVFSTMNEPDISIYPESDKFGVFVGAPPGGRTERSLNGFYNVADDVDYWSGE